ncbi:hypothetical protein FM106_15920 [Brachybacterium faecium]|nr:hypothetical protein FM106_15920 [Brachybacterium faecium]
MEDQIVHGSQPRTLTGQKKFVHSCAPRRGRSDARDRR